jgi:putative oxidoreductase
MRRSIILWSLRIGLAGLYLFAAVPKILDPWSFARAIHNFRILPDAVIPLLSVWLPAFEAVAAVAVATGILYRGGLLALSAMSAAFALGIFSAMVRGLDIDCGCFGSAASSRASLGHLALNVASLAAGIILLAARGQKRRRLPRRT